MKKLSDSEFEIMKVLWKHEKPLTSNYILEEMQGIRDWKLASLMTVLSRLAEKGFVYCDRTTRTNYYTALIGEEEYKLNESQNFLEKLYDNSVQKFLAGLYGGNQISKEELKNLRKYLNEIEGGEK